jgi:hypothetical protein
MCWLVSLQGQQALQQAELLVEQQAEQQVGQPEELRVALQAEPRVE